MTVGKRRGLICGMIAGAALLLALLVWVLPIKNDLALELEYAREYGYDGYAKLMWTVEGEEQEKSSYKQVKNNRVELPLYSDPAEISRLKLEPAVIEAETAITSLLVRNHGIGVYVIPVREILARAEFHYTEQAEVERGVLSVRPEGRAPIMVWGLDIIEEYFISADIRLKAIICVWILMAGLLAAAGAACEQSLQAAYGYVVRNYEAITRTLLIAAVFLVAYMAFCSFDYAHPDENMSKAAVDYYMAHFKPADIRSPEVADSFSIYGNSRLSEITLYYFLAGKVAWIARNLLGIAKYYRAFNVLLFAIMVGIYCKKGRKNGFLFLMLGLTPQVWYIFSYATSDGWDYFLSFLALYQLTAEGSIFNRAMQSAISRKAVWGLVFVGVLYGVLLLGKMNYYFIFVASFLLLLYRLILAAKEKRVQIFTKYAIILTVCLSIYFGTEYMDARRYDGNKDMIAARQKEVYSGKNGESQIDTAVSADVWAGVRMREQGIGLDEVLGKYDFMGESYESYAGTYGWMEHDSPKAYYMAMGILYGMVLVLLWRAMLRGHGIWEKALFCLLMCLGMTVLGASLWHSWVSDFQPQGRYLFAVNFILAVCGYIYYGGLFGKRAMKPVLCAIGSLSIYSFLFSGIFNLT